MHQDATWYGDRSPPRGLCVRWGSSPLPKKEAEPPIFSPCLWWPNGWMDQDGTWHGGIGLGPVHIVLDGDTTAFPQKGAEPPIFGPSLLWLNGWMHQDATWYGGMPQPIRFCVRWGPSPYPKVAEPHPIFGPRLLWPNGWMDEDAALYGSRPRSVPHCTRRGPSSRERGTAAPLFSVHVSCGHGRPSQLLLSSC